MGSSIWKAEATSYGSFLGACVYVHGTLVHSSYVSRLDVINDSSHIGLMELAQGLARVLHLQSLQT